MGEVALQNGSGQAAKLGTLAERINAEHKACGVAVYAALDHAIAAGDLLFEAKAECAHGSWVQWLEANFEGTPRMAQAYMRLAANRSVVEDAKAKSVSHFGVGAALKILAAPKPPKPKPLWGPDPFENLPEGLEPDPDALRQWEEDQAAIAFWKKQNREALQKVRAEERAKGMRSVLLGLDDLMRRYPAEEAGVALAQMAGEGRALEAVGDCIGWLQQTLKVAERAQGREQNGKG